MPSKFVDWRKIWDAAIESKLEINGETAAAGSSSPDVRHASSWKDEIYAVATAFNARASHRPRRSNSYRDRLDTRRPGGPR